MNTLILAVIWVAVFLEGRRRIRKGTFRMLDAFCWAALAVVTTLILYHTYIGFPT